MDIIFQDNNAAKFSISQHGMGTRSWISFLTFAAYVDWHTENVKKDDDEAENFVILTMEEPEAHLHPQAQRHLYNQVQEFQGQKIISTHSPSVLAQASLENIIHFTKPDGKTSAKRFNSSTYTSEELNKIRREVINTRGELLFSNAIVLCEGITEEQALPVFFEEYFGTKPVFCGINIIGIGGQNYKIFLNLIKDFNIKWFIFSDGEERTVNTIRKAIEVLSDVTLETLSNIIILDEGTNYEKYLIKSGYCDDMIKAINAFENNDDFFSNYAKSYNGDLPSKASDKEKKEYILLKLCQNHKAKYAFCIAEYITNNAVKTKCIPAKIKDLFSAIHDILHLIPQEEYRHD
jgi:putative ATP-dependent endonuclease of OLD family